jgi:hypothetical protein
MSFDQIAIAFTGVVALWLSQDRRHGARRWSPIFGLLAQPFWFYTAFTHQQWGVFTLCFLYTASWLRGLWNYWLQPTPQPPTT